MIVHEPAHDTLEAWIASRPESVQKLAREFPLATRVLMPDGELLWIVGWTESDEVLVSPIESTVDYDASIAARMPLCAEHLRP